MEIIIMIIIMVSITITEAMIIVIMQVLVTITIIITIIIMTDRQNSIERKTKKPWLDQEIGQVNTLRLYLIIKCYNSTKNNG